MKLYLTTDVKNIGRKGELVLVADGFGRNFLLARKLASLQPVAVSSQKRSSVISEKDRTALSTLSLQLTARANDQGGLYQAISADEISKALKEKHHISITPNAIQFEQPIKTIGTFSVRVVQGGGVVATLSGEVQSAT